MKVTEQIEAIMAANGLEAVLSELHKHWPHSKVIIEDQGFKTGISLQLRKPDWDKARVYGQTREVLRAKGKGEDSDNHAHVFQLVVVQEIKNCLAVLLESYHTIHDPCLVLPKCKLCEHHDRQKAAKPQMRTVELPNPSA